MITYRDAVALDLPTFVSMDKQLFPYSPWSAEQYKEEFENTTRHFVVALNQAQSIVGYAGVFLPSAGVAADILTVGVVSHERRTGIARTLMALITQWAVAHGANAMILEVKTDNDHAIALYESLDYKKLNVRKDYFGSGLDALVMKLELP